MNKKITNQIISFKKMSIESKRLLKDLIAYSDKKNTQNQSLLVLLTKAVKEFDAYILLIENGYGEQAAQAIRSIYHTCLWMRYNLLKSENAILYFESGKIELTKMLERLLSKGLADIKDFENSELIKTTIKEKSKEIKLPFIEDMAKETGYLDFHDITYKFLSAMAHGSVYILDEDNKLSFLPNENNIEPFFSLANNLFRDCCLLTESWIIKNEIRPVPNFRELIIQEFSKN